MQANRKDAKKRGMVGIAFSHSTLYLKRTIMNATADITQGFTGLYIVNVYLVQELVKSLAAILRTTRQGGNGSSLHMH